MMLLLGFASQLMFYGSAEKKTKRPEKKKQTETGLVCEVLHREVFHKDLDSRPSPKQTPMLCDEVPYRTQLSPDLNLLKGKKTTSKTRQKFQSKQTVIWVRGIYHCIRVYIFIYINKNKYIIYYK